MDNISPNGQLMPMQRSWFYILRNNRGEANPGVQDPPADPAPSDPPADPPAEPPPSDPPPADPPAATSWKDSLSADLRDSAVVKKFEDTPEGLAQAMESHNNLEKLLGHDKVPIPKGVEDVEGWNRFSKAMGIPDNAEMYGLPDANLPEEMKGMTIDKNKFAEVAHAHKLTPEQAKGLWKTYTEINTQAYIDAKKGLDTQLQETINRLKGEWGDAYNVNVELGQMVINKFAEDQESNDYITSILSKDPRGIKFLAKIGDQFAENKFGEFQMKKFTLGPEEAQKEIDRIKNDMDGPYMNASGKYTAQEHQAAVDRVNSLIASIQRAKG